MIRMAGAALLAGGSVILGACGAKHLNGRVNELNQLLAGLEAMTRELSYRMAPLPELLRQAAEQSKGNPALFFNLCAQGAEHLNGRTFQTVWSQALEAAQLRLEQEDMALLEQLGGVLGRYDEESQHRALDTAIARLENQRNAAADQSCRLGRVYSVLSLTAGGFLMILLI